MTYILIGLIAYRIHMDWAFWILFIFGAIIHYSYELLADRTKQDKK